MEASEEKARLRNASMAVYLLGLPELDGLWDQAECLLDQGLTNEAAPLILQMIAEADRHPERIAELSEEWQACLAAVRVTKDNPD